MPWVNKNNANNVTEIDNSNTICRHKKDTMVWHDCVTVREPGSSTKCPAFSVKFMTGQVSQTRVILSTNNQTALMLYGCETTVRLL